MIKEKLKKGMPLLLASLLGASFILGGCGAQQQEETKSAVSSAVSKTESEQKTEPEAAVPETKEESEPEDEAKELAGNYYSKIRMTDEMSVVLYLKIEEDGHFVFARDTEFSSEEKGAGQLGTDAKGNAAFVYSIVNNKEVKEGEKCAAYKVTEKGGIQFTSPMWFGSTEPKITKDGGKEEYPLFEVLDEKTEKKLAEEAKKAEEAAKAEEQKKKEEEKKAEEAKKAEEKKKEEQKKKEEEQQQEETVPAAPALEEEVIEYVEEPAPQPEQNAPAASALTEGTYYGSMEKYVDAMNANVHYDVALTLSGGSYSYSVNITLSGGMDYNGTESYSGTYEVDGNYIAFYGDLYEGSIYGNSILVTGYLSSFAGDMDSVTVFL